jgi:hypothetical protein
MLVTAYKFSPTLDLIKVMANSKNAQVPKAIAGGRIKAFVGRGSIVIMAFDFNNTEIRVHKVEPVVAYATVLVDPDEGACSWALVQAKNNRELWPATPESVVAREVACAILISKGERTVPADIYRQDGDYSTAMAIETEQWGNPEVEFVTKRKITTL